MMVDTCRLESRLKFVSLNDVSGNVAITETGDGDTRLITRRQDQRPQGN